MNHDFNAFLSYKGARGKNLQYNMWVMEYSQPHALSGAQSQAKMFQHFYPKSYSPGNITVIGRVPEQVDYDNLGNFVRNYHKLLMNSAGLSNAGSGQQLPLMRLHIDGEGINIQGVVSSFKAGAKRFNVAPQFTFDFMVIKDAHSKNADMHPGWALRQLWTGKFIDQGPVDTTPTPTVNTNTGLPTSGGISKNRIAQGEG